MHILSQHPSTNAYSRSQHHLAAQLVVLQLKSFGLTPLDYWDGKTVEPGGKRPFPESAQHAINLGLLQIRDSSYLFDLIELLRRGLDKRN